jgi:hypothetical protein
VTIRARIRPTEIEDVPDGARTPAIRARLVSADGGVQFIRLWPTAEQDVFEGRFQAPPAGSYDLQVGTTRGAGPGGSNVDVVVSVVAAAQHPAGDAAASAAALRLIAATTGGVAVTTADLVPLERYLRSLSSSDVERQVRPARSLVMALLFASLLCAEWTIRRRKGIDVGARGSGFAVRESGIVGAEKPTRKNVTSPEPRAPDSEDRGKPR